MAEPRTTTARRKAPLGRQKRGDLVAEEIKRWIGGQNLRPGDRLPKESELQATFAVSKGTIREALKSLEVQGLITVSTGPAGGATIGEVPLDLTFQLLQNYLFFHDVTVHDIYALRRIVEPELAAGAVPHLTEAQIAGLERSIEVCAPQAGGTAQALEQRQEDLHFHDILAEANPNPLLRFVCQIINQMLRHLVALGDPASARNRRFGESNLAAHRKLVAAIRRRDAAAVRELMLAHIIEAETHVGRAPGAMRKRLVLDSDMRMSISPRHAPRH
jgi:GntR family transcriptional regulator, transcriptional repressor for pyruvate dehydrogenase complex